VLTAADATLPTAAIDRIVQSDIFQVNRTLQSDSEFPLPKFALLEPRRLSREHDEKVSHDEFVSVRRIPGLFVTECLDWIKFGRTPRREPARSKPDRQKHERHQS